MSKEFLDRNPHLRERFEMWKKAQAAEGELLIQGNIEAAAVSSKWAVRLKTSVRVGGKVLFLAAVSMDTYAFYSAESKSRELARIAGGWTGAAIGAKVGGIGGSKVGAGIAIVAGNAGPQALGPEEIVTVPIAVTVCSVCGVIGGGMIGYWTGSQLGTAYYDFILQGLEDTCPGHRLNHEGMSDRWIEIHTPR